VEIKSEQQGPVSVIVISGSLDAVTAPKLTEFISHELGSGSTKLVVDLTGLDYTSSAGLRVLLSTTKEARQKGGDLRVASVQPSVKKVFELSGFTSILKFFPDVVSAVSSFA
jgi:anti-sigma B factor antagonist